MFQGGHQGGETIGGNKAGQCGEGGGIPLRQGDFAGAFQFRPGVGGFDQLEMRGDGGF